MEDDEVKEIENLLQIRGFRVVKIEDRKEGKITKKVIYLESKRIKAKCLECGEYTKSVHDKLKPMELKYLKIAEQDVVINVVKKRFICHKCNKRFTEETDLNGKGRSISNKLRQKILKDLLDYNLSIKYIAEHNGNISTGEVRNILKEAMKDYPDHVETLPRVISLDEFKANTSEGKYACVLNDPIHKKTLNVYKSRKKEFLVQEFTYCTNGNSVEFVVSDMYEPYLLVTQIMFPKAKYVADPFHYTKCIMEALDKIRRRLQESYGYNSKNYRMLKNKRNVSLLRRYSADIDWWTYTKRYKNKHMVEVLKYDLREQLLKIDEDLHQGYILKELFLDIIRHCTYEDAEASLKAWIGICKESNIKEFIEASNTIENWLPYIVNSFILIDGKRISNGYTEGLNNKIKVIKRVGFGYRNFDFFRLRLMYILNGTLSGITKKNRNSKKSKNN